MVTEAILTISFTILTGLFSMLPEISWTINGGVFSHFLNIVRLAAYMLPTGTISAIVSIIVSITIFKIVITIIKTVWELLPIL